MEPVLPLLVTLLTTIPLKSEGIRLLNSGVRKIIRFSHQPLDDIGDRKKQGSS